MKTCSLKVRICQFYTLKAKVSEKEKLISLIGEDFDPNPHYGHQSIGSLLSLG
jgi:hypothetical protein